MKHRSFAHAAVVCLFFAIAQIARAQELRQGTFWPILMFEKDAGPRLEFEKPELQQVVFEKGASETLVFDKGTIEWLAFDKGAVLPWEFDKEPLTPVVYADFPPDFLKPADPPPPAGLPTSAGLASGSAASLKQDGPPPEPVEEVDPSEGVRDFWSNKSHFCRHSCRFFKRLWDDQFNFYTWENAGWMALGILGAAPIANTPLDQHFRDWYQGNWGNNTSMNRFALDVKNLGEGAYMIPAFLAGGVLSIWMEDLWPSTGPIEEWFGMTLRGWATGTPSLLIAQKVLGPSRPFVGDQGSYWKPFKDSHGASGHTFMGSMPFLTAAAMVENPWLKGTLIAGSFATGWSRIQTDDHYLSQVLLGWWLAYRTVQCVATTQRVDRNWDVFPSATPDGGAQLNLLVRY